MRAPESPFESYKSERILFFANLIFSSILGPKTQTRFLSALGPKTEEKIRLAKNKIRSDF